jgi:hypothetical protein
MKVTYAAEALGDAAQVLSFVADQSTVARVRRCNSHRHGGEGLVPLTGVCVARKAACQWPGFGSLRNMGCGELVSERRCKCHVAGKEKPPFVGWLMVLGMPAMKASVPRTFSPGVNSPATH